MSEPVVALKVGVDTGGTFTDVVASDGRALKVPSTPADPSRAVASGLSAAGPVGPGGASRRIPEVLAHGTTVATNALLERRGSEVALVTTAGLTDVIEIGRQDRPSLYDLWADRPAPLVSRKMRLEVPGRLGADGSEIEAAVPGAAARAVAGLPSWVRAVAVCLLHSDLDDSHERQAAQELEATGVEVSRSSEVSPEYREFERTVTTVINAYLGPVCRQYLQRLAEMADQVLVMTSAGGLVPLARAAARPASLLVSGPAAGAKAAAAAAAAAGFPDAVTLDMGGTSTDVCLVRGGVPEPAAQRTVAGFPVRLPAMGVHTIGAGGGSVASIDPGGALQVGPRSAGAAPGPACYGLGGVDPTVTDADVALGRIPQGTELPGIGGLDAAASERALARAGVTAEGVVAVVDAAMVRAVRAVSVERGVDPRSLALVAFGGAGPLHACSLAGSLGMPAVVVPRRAGMLSAEGLLSASPQADLVRSWPGLSSLEGLQAALEDLAGAAAGMVSSHGGAGAATRGGGPAVEVALDCRYSGQSHELTVPSVGEFHAEHRRRNGYDRPDAPVEVVAVRARATGPPLVGAHTLGPSGERRPAVGPRALAEEGCTVWLPEGWRAEVGGGGSWILTR